MESHIIYLKNRFYKVDEPAHQWSQALIYSNENKQWMTHLDPTDSKKIFSDLNEKKWIRLIKADGYYRHEGPFSDHEMFEMLKKSQISFKDPVWKKGLTQWSSLANMETFRGLLDIKEQNNLRPEETADLLDSVIEMRRVEASVPMDFIEAETELSKAGSVQAPEKVDATDKEDTVKEGSTTHLQNEVIVLRGDFRSSYLFEKILISFGVMLLFLYAFMKWFV